MRKLKAPPYKLIKDSNRLGSPGFDARIKEGLAAVPRGRTMYNTDVATRMDRLFLVIGHLPPGSPTMDSPQVYAMDEAEVDRLRNWEKGFLIFQDHVLDKLVVRRLTQTKQVSRQSKMQLRLTNLNGQRLAFWNLVVETLLQSERLTYRQIRDEVLHADEGDEWSSRSVESIKGKVNADVGYVMNDLIIYDGNRGYRVINRGPLAIILKQIRAWL